MFLQVLCQFQNLQILYLHGNTITNLNEVDKLIELPNLKKLTLHGNPIENDKVCIQVFLTPGSVLLETVSISVDFKQFRAHIFIFSHVAKGPFKCYVMLFSWKLDPHPPPRSANSIEHYTFVTLFSGKSDTRPLPSALRNT